MTRTTSNNLSYANSVDVTGLNDQVNTNTNNITSNTTSINTLNSSVASLNTNVSNNTSSINTLNSSVSTLNTNVTNNTTNINSLNARVTTAEGNISTNTSSINALTNRFSTTTVKIGIGAGNNVALNNSVSIGNTAGTSAGSNTVNIGTNAASQGDNGICIGQNARSNVNSAIVLNGIGTTLTASQNSLYIDPIRNDILNNNVLTYNATTKEINQNNTLWSELDSRISATNSNTITNSNNIATNANNITTINNTINTRLNSANVRFGTNAGLTSQSTSGIAIGLNAGQNNQGQRSIAIGDGAATLSSGIETINIGYMAGYTSSVNNSICINASGVEINPLNSGTYIAPIREDTNGTSIMTYNSISKEVNYNNALYSNLTNSISAVTSTVDRTKAYAYCVYNAQSQTIINSYNISTVTYSATGQFRFNFISGLFTNSNYICVASCNKPDNIAPDDGNSLACLGSNVSGRQFTNTYVPVTTVYWNGSTLNNPTKVCVVCYYNNPNL